MLDAQRPFARSRRSCRRRRCSSRRRRRSPTSATGSRCTARCPPPSRCRRTKRRSIAILRRCHAARVPVVARGAGTSLSGGALPAANGVVLSLAKFKRILVDRPADAHRRGPARRAQPVDLGRGRGVRTLLRARSVVADRMLDRRQRRGERRRRALPQVRPHRAQRAARARRAHHRRDRRVRRRRARRARLRSAGADHRQRGPARRHHRDHRQAAAEAAARAGRARGVRRTSSRRARRWATSSPRASSRRDSR